MKHFSITTILVLCSVFFMEGRILSQDLPVKPAIKGVGTYHGLTPPLKSLPVLSDEEFRKMETDARKDRNGDMKKRSYPFASTALPKGPDPVWQHEMGYIRQGRGLILNFNGQQSPYYPPDANGTAGPLYYMQTINTVYAIYDKNTGEIVVGPTNMNELFSGVTGSGCNDGDPLILYDEQADRWLAVEFSLCGANDRMLVAVSQTDDPTGSWHKYSFDVADVPDYEKFGIWSDGYYMGTNNSFGNDIYVFEREQMLDGGTAQFIGFNNPWRPTTIDGFMCVPPVDNDGPAAPEGAPGLFITLNDDAIAGGNDQLWIYELDVDWNNPDNSTFIRSQQVNVPAFDSNFGNTWDNIKQPGTGQELDGIPMVIMNRPQYRNFGSYETIVCCHTVDLDNTDHAGIRWYELRRTGGDWSIRQTGTYGPDEHSRWMGSISLNGQNEIGLAYSISSTTVYPGIRYCGQSPSAYASATGIMDITEEIIHTSSNSQTGANRWGDYADLSVDPDNDRTFWFTSQYPGSGGSRRTKIASFEFDIAPLVAAFTVNTESPCQGTSVIFTDVSAGDPIHWKWTFEGGTPPGSTQQNPEITYNETGFFDVRLIVTNGFGTDTLFLEDYIQVVNTPGQAGIPEGPANVCQGGANIPFTVESVEFATGYDWFTDPPDAGTFTGHDTISYLDIDPDFAGTFQVSVLPFNDCGPGISSGSYMVTVHPGPVRFNIPEDGGYCEGGSGFELILDGSENGVSYELYMNGISTGHVRQGTGNPLNFGYQTAPGEYTVMASNDDCSLAMIGKTIVYFLPGPEIAATPEGPAELCNSLPGDYTTAGAQNAEFYIWHLDPPAAGTIAGNGTSVRITWNGEFEGVASLTVQGATECAAGALSETFQVSVIEAPHPDVAGQTAPCSESTGKVYFYNTPASMENSYYWTVEGGSLVTGQGTGQAMITWNIPGAGMVMVTESAPNGCSTTDTLQVNIYDCTGIEEIGPGTLTLYPNPVEDLLTIVAELDDAGAARLFIYNSNGSTVIQNNIQPEDRVIKLTVSTSGLPAGNYSLQILTGKGNILEGKFMKVIN